MTRLAERCFTACLLLTAGLHAATASAQTDDTAPPPDFQITGNVGVVSDYRYRGISLSNRDPAIQGGFDVSHKSGLFAGTWASSLADNGGADMELDLYGGYAGKLGGLDYSATFLGYVYPGTHGLDYYELKGAVGKTIGPATLGMEVSWVPDQGNYPGNNVYVAGKAEVGIPNTPVTLHVRGGRESNDGLRKWDWEAGAAYNLGKLSARLAYVDSNYGGIDEAGKLGRATVVASLIATF